MKGIVFTEFLDFVEAQSGYETVDRILEMAAPQSGCAYTAVGNYPYAEMSTLISALSEVSGYTTSHLLRQFGTYLFSRFAAIYPGLFKNNADPLNFLETVESRIHAEVLKLYPDAELPSIKTKRISDDVLSLNYRSCRPLGQLCIGLIHGCGAHFDAKLDVEELSVAGGLDITIRRVKADSCSEQKEAEALS